MNYQQDHITFIAQTCRFKVNRHLIEKHDNYLSALARLPQNIFDDFTKENGATVIIPGSHKWSDNRVPDKNKDKLVPAVMKKGSCLCLLSTTWHAGGQNMTNKPRLAISNQHCEPYIRPQENQILSVPFKMVKDLDPRLQSMIGYSIHYPFIGHSNGMHPLRAIESKL